jgi:hypothetical protein
MSVKWDLGPSGFAVQRMPILPKLRFLAVNFLSLAGLVVAYRIHDVDIPTQSLF